MTMIGTAVGQMAAAAAVRFTTTTMSTYPIRRSHHAATAIILQDLRLQTVRGESAGRVVSVDQGESAGQAMSGVRAELAGVLLLSVEQGHLLGHTTQPPR